MVVLVTCKNEEDPIKSNGAREGTSLFIDEGTKGWSQHLSNYKSMWIFQDTQGQLTA